MANFVNCQIVTVHSASISHLVSVFLWRTLASATQTMDWIGAHLLISAFDSKTAGRMVVVSKEKKDTVKDSTKDSSKDLPKSPIKDVAKTSVNDAAKSSKSPLNKVEKKSPNELKIFKTRFVLCALFNNNLCLEEKLKVQRKMMHPKRLQMNLQKVHPQLHQKVHQRKCQKRL